MALVTYADLQAAIGTWNVNKTNLPTADLITLAEARLKRDLRARMLEVDVPLTTSAGDRLVALPAAMIEPRALYLELASGRTELVFIPQKMDTSSSATRPELWSIEGTNIVFPAPADQVYGLTFTMLQGFNLADAANTSSGWLYSTYPDVYLAAGNVEAALWLQDDAQAQRWQLRYADAVAEINEKEARASSLATLRVDPAIQPRATRRSTFDVTRG